MEILTNHFFAPLASRILTGLRLPVFTRGIRALELGVLGDSGIGIRPTEESFALVPGATRITD